jgi:uncharacterized protein YndB with AHSA1/START domain
MTEPLELVLDLAATPDHAWATWTDRIDRWWPADHTVSGDPDATIVLEPGEGGRILERTPDGTEHHWGTVTTWDPPRLLGYTWHLGRDASAATDVLISFAPSPAGTTVEIRHTGWDRLGAEAGRWRDRNHQGWSTLLPHFEGILRDG